MYICRVIIHKPLKNKKMKKLILGLLVLSSLVFGFSFTKQKEKEDKLSGSLQIFVNSYKTIESTPVASQSSFEDRKSDSIVEGFQMYTFDFNDNTVEHNFVLADTNGVLDVYNIKSKITSIETDGSFAYLTVDDESLYYSDIKEKIFVVNLNSDQNYPVLSVFWKNGKSLKGTYSSDNNTFDGLVGKPDSNKVFND